MDTATKLNLYLLSIPIVLVCLGLFLMYLVSL